MDQVTATRTTIALVVQIAQAGGELVVTRAEYLVALRQLGRAQGDLVGLVADGEGDVIRIRLGDAPAPARPARRRRP